MNSAELVDLMVFDGLYEIFYGYHMGSRLRTLLRTTAFSREEQDQLGALSHQRARKAIADGICRKEIAPVVIPRRKATRWSLTPMRDPMDTSVEKMAKLAPAFKKNGTVTAGNASGINDAAAALLVMSATKAKELGLKPW